MIEITKLEDIRHNYDDIINLKYKPKNKMSIINRASQFAPFAALSGYGDLVYEASRNTDFKRDLDEDLKEIIDRKLQLIDFNSNYIITYFVKDNKKDGGRYISINKRVKKIDTVFKKIIFVDKECIDIDDIIDIKKV